jgi:hypothetical protein
MSTKPKTAKPVIPSKQIDAPEKRASRASRPKAGPLSAPHVPPAKLNKRDSLAAMLLRDEGATVDQMVVGLGWLPHTVRAAMTGLKKLGYAIDSDKIDGLRTYRAVAPK